MQTVLVYCQVSFGADHWVCTSALIESLARQFRVVLALRGKLTDDLAVSPDIEMVNLPERPSRAGAALIELARRVRPAAVVVEYFPFGRQDSSKELVPLLEFTRSYFKPPPFVVCSLRDIQQCRRRRQQQFDARACELINRYFDAVLVHSDPKLFSLRMTFAGVGALRVPVYHTGYVVPAREAPRWSGGDHNRRVVVSVGGGRGGEELLRTALEAHQKCGLADEFTMRVIAGTYLDGANWDLLRRAAVELPRFEAVRWVSDLRQELATASVSVSRCGYNTALDLLRTGVPALVVPYTTLTEDEQTRRAVKLARMGAVRWLAPWRADYERLAAEIRHTAHFRPRPLRLDMDGARRSAEMISDGIRGSANYS